jgi:pimeloyl-ACP methyl ester carboxylesterase
MRSSICSKFQRIFVRNPRPTIFYRGRVASAKMAVILPLITLTIMSQPSRAGLPELVHDWLKSEIVHGTPSEHQKRVLWARHPGEGRKSPYAALVIHGLYNSPKHMLPVTPVFTERDMNVMMTRLKGHWENDSTSLTETITWQEWMKQAEEDFALAQELGDHVILVGHSTGALLATWLQMKKPEKVAALVLFSPAFEIHPLAATAAWLGSMARIHPVLWDGRLIAGHAGLEVISASAIFQKWIRDQGEGFMAERLSHTPVWMANTELDMVVDLKSAAEFLRMAKRHNPEQKPRMECMISLLSWVSHDAIVSETNPEMHSLHSSLRQFLSTLPANPIAAKGLFR